MAVADRLMLLFVLAAAVVTLVFMSPSTPVVGSSSDDIPNDRINKSKRLDPGAVGPAYLLSNLPASRPYDDRLPLVADGASYVIPISEGS